MALALRSAWAVVYGRVDAAVGDAGFNETAANALAGGDGFSQLGHPTAHQPPGFPFLVSLLYRAFGTHLKLALALNVGLGVATVAFVYFLGWYMLGRPGGLIAGGTFAVLPAPIFFTGLFLSETTFVFMLTGFLVLAAVLPRRRWTPVVLGVVAGAAALMKGEGILLVVIPPAMWWGELGRREWLTRSAVLLAVTALTVAPWTIRNAIQMDAFVPVATNASTTLWVGHNAKANGGGVAPPDSLLARIPKGLDPTRREVAEAALLRNEAVHWAVRNPLKELGLIPRRLMALGNASSQALPIFFDAEGDYEVGSSSRVVFGTVGDALDYFLIAVTLSALVLLGAGHLWRFHPIARAALAYLAACLVTYGVVYYGQFRYRIPMEPMMILVATPLLLAVWRNRRLLRQGP